jgi:hypothetical protein
VLTVLESQAAKSIATRPLNRSPGSRESLRKAKSWLENCLARHDHSRELRESQSRNLMPTRVIHVGSADSDTVCVEDKGKQEVGAYAALSYCWGEKAQNNLTTTRNTLSERQKGIAFDQLPKTIQDAITTTRALGLKYLWVDALCIIQDDENDKSKEIAKMSQTYMSATVTISAARATHCDEGFLHERDLQEAYINVFQLLWHVDAEHTDLQTVFCAEGDIQLSRKDPLDSRAWTMQEHELSPRLLRFGEAQLIWSCADWDLVDGGSTGNDQGSGRTGVDGDLDNWRQKVEKYTARSISNPEDRLSAFGAIAEQYGKVYWRARPGDYLAGLWKQGLPSLLLWSIPTERTSELAAPEDYKNASPTWSWHHAPCAVEYLGTVGSQDDTPSLQIERCGTVPATVAKYGRVVRGWLLTRGYMQEVHWSGRSFWISEPGDLDGIASITVKWDMAPERTDDVLFCCLEVIEEGLADSYGLVLTAVRRHTFRRVGCFQSSRREASKTRASDSERWLRKTDRRRITIV